MKVRECQIDLRRDSDLRMFVHSLASDFFDLLKLKTQVLSLEKHLWNATNIGDGGGVSLLEEMHKWWFI